MPARPVVVALANIVAAGGTSSMNAAEMTPRRSRARAMLVAQIPQRVSDLRKRGESMSRDGWDINAMQLLAEDAEALADSSDRLGDEKTSIALVGFAELLWSLLDVPALPSAEGAPSIAAMLQGLVSAPVSSAPMLSELGDEATLFGYAANEDNGYPLLQRPPTRYWRRFTTDAPVSAIDAEPSLPAVTAIAVSNDTLATVESALVEPSPLVYEPVPVRGVHAEPASIAFAQDPEPSRKRAYHLADGSSLAVEIDLHLRAQGYQLHRLESVDGLKEMLSRTSPSLVVMSDQHHAGIEEIGALVQAARARTGRRVSLVALSLQTDLATRLRAMRAGCDAFIALPTTADDVLTRIRELADAENAEPYRIMIVEDDRSQAMFAESILRKTGMQTLAVSEASLVLEKLEAFKPDLILMDLNMPECDGMELTALIRDREAFISTPIVFLSGESDTERHFEALSAGGDDFLSKPIAPKHLITAVSSRVRRARLLEKRRTPAMREPVKGLHDIVQLTRRLTEMLAMEDASSRSGGLLFVEVEDAQRLRGRLTARACDAVMSAVTDALASHIGISDMLARCGETGFLLLNPDRSSEALEKQAINLRERISHETFAAEGAAIHLAIVIGICPFTAAAGDAKAMSDAAEGAMLEARAPDRGGVSTYLGQAPDAVESTIVPAMREALENSGFRVVFQPIVSLHGEEDEQFQALLRLPMEDGRMYAASELVPAAEAAGLIA
ncbi:MAG: response regulator, partial [Dokdonella sp.]